MADADEIFSRLMGDQVEPRREFIEQNTPNVVDAISCMERMGPRGGDIVRLDLIMTGRSAAEVDCVGCAVMETVSIPAG